ncbi:uncharacterized protein LOC135831696 isoform X2 [Planococcus citri]|uniref:uncharacterized protein LOC135831696 isoform X2 n=1 Tax=Planococcus citri TaxID=170843 RepID=UPI0031F8C71E
MIRKFSPSRSTKTIFTRLFVLLYYLKLTSGIRLQGVSDLIHNFEAMDPEVLNLLTFRNKPANRNKEDASEINIMDVDTSDILNCFSTLSYVCFQKKILIYLDSLNRVDRINLFGGYLSFVRISKGLTPPITEQLLASRHISDESTLSNLLKEVFEDFVETHVLRITVPVINTRLDGRGARGHCYDFNLADAKDENGTQKAAKDPTCYRGDQSMMALSSALIMKMLMLLPALLKVIAAKAIFGLAMGVVSVILSKMALLPLLLSYANKPPVHGNANVAPTTGSFRQGVNPTNFALTTDNYNTYYQQEEQPGRLTTAVGGSIDNDIGPIDYGPTAISSDNVWSESKFINKNYNVAAKDPNYVPRKERYRSISRRHVSKPKRTPYSEVASHNDRYLMTTIVPRTERMEKQLQLPVRMKRDLNPKFKHENELSV